MYSFESLVLSKGPMLSIANLSKGYVGTLDFKGDFPGPGFHFAQMLQLLHHLFTDSDMLGQ
jgi:hypothetical protein